MSSEKSNILDLAKKLHEKVLLEKYKLPEEKVEPREPSELISYEHLKRYHEINQQIKRLEEEKKQLNERFKLILGENNTTYENGDLYAKIVVQDRSSLDEEKAAEFLKQKGLENCITYKPEIKKEELQKALYNGSIAPKDLEAFIIPKKIVTLTVGVIKGKAGDQGENG